LDAGIEMSRQGKLSVLERTFVNCMQTLTELTEGYAVTFLDELVRQHGISGFFRWAKATNKVWADLVERYGERETQLLAAFGSFWNGCAYCAYGHLLAHNLLVFKEGGTLFPIDEDEVDELLQKRDQDILDRVRERLSSPAFEQTRTLIERQYALKSGAPPQSEDDRLLLTSVALYEWINECSIVVKAPAPPFSPIAKQRTLRSRYEELRKRQRVGE
jgi:hypothetical protein